MIAALYVDPAGPFVGRPNVDPWTESRDARLYAGPFPVVAFPPCGPHGTFATAGRTSKDDKGTGRAAVGAVRLWGGVLEQPARSRLFKDNGLPLPPKVGWSGPDEQGGRSCRVDQAAYGHKAQKATWLYAVLPAYPDLDWRRTPGTHLIGRRDHHQNTAARAAAKAAGTYVALPELPRRERHLTPEPFAALLLGMAASCAFATEADRKVP